MSQFCSSTFYLSQKNVPVWRAGDLQHVTEHNETMHVFEDKEKN